MVAINKILLPECTVEECGGETDVRTDSRVYPGNAENRAPTTRNHRRTRPLGDNLYQGMTLDAVTGLYYERNRDYSPSLGRWMEQDPVQFIDGANTYQFVDSSPVGNVDAEGASLWTALGGALGGLGSQLGMLAEEALSAYNRAITALMPESLPPYLRTLPICKIPPLAHSPYHGLTFMKSETKGNFGPAGGSVSGGVSAPIRGTPFSVWGYGSGSLSPNGTFAPTKGMLGLSF